MFVCFSCCLYHSIAAAVANVYGDYLNTLSSEEMEDRQQTVRGKVYEQLIKNTSKYKDFFPVVGADQMSPDDLDEARKLESTAFIVYKNLLPYISCNTKTSAFYDNLVFLNCSEESS